MSALPPSSTGERTASPSRPAHAQSWRRWSERLVFLALLLAAQLLREMQGSGLREAVIWLPSGVAVAGLWRLGAGSVWIVALSAVLVRLQVGYPSVIIIFGCVGACAEALLGAWLVRSLRIDSAFARLKDVSRLFLVAAVTPLASMLFSWIGRLLPGNGQYVPFYTGWDGWWRMNALGILCVTPVFAILFRGKLESWTVRMRAEAAAVFATLLAVIALVLNTSTIGSTSVLLLYAVLPIAAFAAFRLGPLGAASTAAVAAISIFAATLSEHGPFIALPIDQRHGALQIFTFAILTGPLLLGAIIAERKRDHEGIHWHSRVLELIATGQASKAALGELVSGIERLIAGSRASLLLLEGEKLRHSLAPSLPQSYCESVDGLEIGPRSGSCGTAAHSGEPCIASDIHSDPNWARFRELVGPYGLRSCWSMPVRDSKGTVLGTFAVYFDEPRSPTDDELALLERAAALAGIALERERSEDLLKTINRNVNEGLFRSSSDRGFHYVNDAFARMLGYDSARQLMALRPEILHVEPERMHEFRRRLANAPSAASEEFLLRRRDGSTFWALVNAAATRDAEGRVLHFDGAVVDISQRRALEERLRQAQKMEAVGRLAGGVAHDFNNLITAIDGYAESLERSTKDEATRRAARQILEASERAAGLTRQLLAYSRQQVLSPQLQDLTQVVDDMGALLRRVIGEHIRFSIQHAQSGVFANCDRVQVEQVVLNLAINARDALPQGGSLTIDTTPLELDEKATHGHEHVRAGPFVRLRVRDDGAGMDELTRQRAFDPFFTTKEQGKGTGLGLSTVYGIVHQSGGFVALDSAPGRGTTVSVYLPRAQAPQQTAPAPERPAAKGNERGTGLVLVVEDEPMVREIVTVNLRSAGYQVLEASNGEEALALGEPRLAELDLVITDRIMPRLGGDGLAAQLRRVRADLPVLFMSGYAETPAPASVVGPVAHLAKPFARAELLGKVATLLAAARAPQTA
ncbi:MAG: MASE1 domain-containing protein [Planctomycetota bacterium]|nr:MASE1 domain-containing protein [Planctomycetota bacterium]